MAGVRIMDTDFNLYGYIEGYSSLQFKRSLYEVGNFELHVNGQDKYANQLQKGRIAFLDEAHAGRITKVTHNRTLNGYEIVCYGNQLKGIVANRIVLPDETADNQHFGYDRYPNADSPEEPVENAIKYYANKHMCCGETRKFPHLLVVPSQERGNLIRWSARFETLETLFKEIGQCTDVGYDITLDVRNKRYLFDTIHGRDHTAQSVEPVIFGCHLGNITDMTYTADDSALLTYAYAGGYGEDESRLIMAVSNIPIAGFERIEGFLDCGSLELPADICYEAEHKLKDKITKETLTCNVINGYGYGEKWDIGDTVTLVDREIGVEADRQITSALEVWESGTHKITQITFGERENTLLDQIRKKERIR